METNIQIVQPQIIELVSQKIYKIRGLRMMMDYDLAELYGVETKQLNLAVKRNQKRFPADFMFQLDKKEYDAILRCQIGTSRYEQPFVNEGNPSLRFHFETLKSKRGQHRKYPPYAFTEQGIAMLSGILNSDRAISVNIAIMRAFIALRQYALNYAELSTRLDEFMKSTDSNFSEVFYALEELTTQKKLYENRRPIGFIVRDEETS